MSALTLVTETPDPTPALPMSATGAVVLLIGVVVTGAWLLYLYR